MADLQQAIEDLLGVLAFSVFQPQESLQLITASNRCLATRLFGGIEDWISEIGKEVVLLLLQAVMDIIFSLPLTI
ncbi:MAG: hypothetical protein AAFQ63_09370 [Cyanobacteria bacterium J06621_11]